MHLFILVQVIFGHRRDEIWKNEDDFAFTKPETLGRFLLFIKPETQVLKCLGWERFRRSWGGRKAGFAASVLVQVVLCLRSLPR